MSSYFGLLVKVKLRHLPRQTKTNVLEVGWCRCCSMFSAFSRFVTICRTVIIGKFLPLLTIRVESISDLMSCVFGKLVVS